MFDTRHHRIFTGQPTRLAPTPTPGCPRALHVVLVTVPVRCVSLSFVGLVQGPAHKADGSNLQV